MNVSNSKNDQTRDNSLRVILTTIVVGIAAILLISISVSVNKPDKSVFWSVTGLSVLIGLSSLLCGGALGFLFGIPLSLQKNNSNIPSDSGGAAKAKAPRERAYGNNTNLEQISDWLTKIIVGVGLTQLPAISRHFNSLAEIAAAGFVPYLIRSFGIPYVYSLILFFLLCGFLAVYLWARIYFLTILVGVEDTLFGVNAKIRTAVNIQDIKLQIAKIESTIDEFNKAKNKLLVVENKPEFKDIINRAKPGPIKYSDDCQKDRWGTESATDELKLSATFSKTDSLEDVYQITLEITRIDRNTTPLGDSYFFLHDSFYPECVQKAELSARSASIQISSFEAFTVGAICTLGDELVKLELDLNDYTASPEDFKYKTPLQTIDDLNQKLNELKASIVATTSLDT